ncbi:hypothetical protein ACH4UM_17255 [Streptomyces sp. NPDC020801]|uniref:hypothetical protein n=1 Tax=Streptomyces sp. NPDC020801 TaxID=3365093 RepID=UPI0037A6A2D2
MPAAGLAMWLTQSNGHGLVAVYGFLLGAAALSLTRRLTDRRAPAKSACPPADSGASS